MVLSITPAKGTFLPNLKYLWSSYPGYLDFKSNILHT